MILKQPAFQAYKGIHIAGIEGKRFDIEMRDGRFTLVVEAGPDREALERTDVPEVVGQDTSHPEASPQKLWISPGIIDLHTHLAWTDFDHDDQLARDGREVEKMQAEALAATLRTGVTTARDAGGLPPETIRLLVQHYQQPLRVETSSAMLGAADAKGTRHLEKRLAEVYATGAGWVKIMATGGLGAPAEKVIEPNFSEEEFAFIVRHAHEHGKKVLVHTWGGVTIDWSAQAGVASFEHGMFLTRDQAGRLAEAGVAYVPTASIYQIAADPKGVLGLPPVISERAARAADAHAAAIGYAREAGVRLGFGTDYATPALHGYNLQELDTLIGYGLSRAAAWRSATEDAAVILGKGHELGRIAEGYLADAVIYTADPHQARNADELRGSIAAVITAAKESDLI
ncbi:amidohydrolase family protein [Paenibacillus piscarius]|uniref:amidohydrolase family protein n=1 Tax=Paenibacillus piscarius TaxID=1089681 RepID=UPI001EE7E467|nr:amidohydrolase family protein [Paenibacillus piscarius]